jgi:RimJ/RimL family protein N-acetyltransferase
MKIRRIRLGESALYREVRLSALKESPDAFTTTYESAAKRSPESWQSQADGSAKGTDRATFLAFAEGEPIGIAALYRDEGKDEGEILQVWISPELRGTGIAAELVEAVIDWGRSQRITRIRAGITEGNSRALRFYMKMGFTSSGRTGTNGEVVLLKETGAEQTGRGQRSPLTR